MSPVHTLDRLQIFTCHLKVFQIGRVVLVPSISIRNLNKRSDTYIKSKRLPKNGDMREREDFLELLCSPRSRIRFSGWAVNLL